MTIPPTLGPPALGPPAVDLPAVDPESPRPGTQSRLVVLAPLKLEQLALGPSSRVGPVSVRVEHIGMGLAKAGQAARRLSAAPAPTAVAVTGLGGALTDGLVPGDLVVADRLIDTNGNEVSVLPSAALVASELRRSGLRAKTGTVVSTDHIVTGPERAALAALGADVVDMESTAVVEAGWRGVPLAIVRAVSDSPGVELFSPAGARGVFKALRALRSSRPALADWAAAVGPREIFLAEPRSFCAGVRRAIETVQRALERYGPPVYVRRQIVHNVHVVSQLEAAGAVFVEDLDEVPDGANLVFSAHGVGTSVREEAARRQMSTIDATCPLVTKVHTEARRFSGAGRQLVLIGHAGHDEVEGTLGTVPAIALVSRPEDVAHLQLDAEAPTAFLTQTTLATDEVKDVVAALEERFLDLSRPAASDICYASQNRQEAVREIAPDCDLVLVVGSRNSSNSNRLVEVARRAGARAELVDSQADLHLSWLAGARRVGVTAGASAPPELVEDLVDCLAGLGPASVIERSTRNEHVSFPLPLEVR
jgi:4-hydroxy-3-methylbut-2-en-1-yl diphosphate reductase